jgi:hypothetical protein
MDREWNEDKIEELSKLIYKWKSGFIMSFNPLESQAGN